MIWIKALHTRKAYRAAGYTTEARGRLYHPERPKYAAVPQGDGLFCLQRITPEEYDGVFGFGAYCGTFGFHEERNGRIYSDNNTDSAFDLAAYRFVRIRRPEFESVFGRGSYNEVQKRHAAEWFKSAFGYDPDDKWY